MPETALASPGASVPPSAYRLISLPAYGWSGRIGVLPLGTGSSPSPFPSPFLSRSPSNDQVSAWGGILPHGKSKYCPQLPTQNLSPATPYSKPIPRDSLLKIYRGETLSLSQLRRRVDALKRKLAVPFAVAQLRPPRRRVLQRVGHGGKLRQSAPAGRTQGRQARPRCPRTG